MTLFCRWVVIFFVVVFFAAIGYVRYADAAALGLDLGSSTYKLAVVKAGGIEIILNEMSKRKTTNLIAFHPSEGPVYGDAALSVVRRSNATNLHPDIMLIIAAQAQRWPERAIAGANLAMGVPFELVPLQNTSLSKNARGTAQLVVDDESIPVEVLVSMFLAKIKQQALPVRDIAIAVPPYFSQSQRQAMLDAAELAGLNLLSLINEGTAGIGSYLFCFACDRTDCTFSGNELWTA